MHYRIKMLLILLILIGWFVFAKFMLLAMNAPHDVTFYGGVVGMIMSWTVVPTLIWKVARYKSKKSLPDQGPAQEQKHEA